LNDSAMVLLCIIYMMVKTTASALPFLCVRTYRSFVTSVTTQN